MPFAKFTIQKQEPFTIRITILESHGNEQDFQDIINGFYRLFEYERRMGVIIDASALVSMSMTAVPQIVKFMRNNRHLFQAYVFGTALVVQSAVVRNVISAVFKIQKPVSPNCVVRELQKAEDFVFEMSNQ